MADFANAQWKFNQKQHGLLLIPMAIVKIAGILASRCAEYR